MRFLIDYVDCKVCAKILNMRCGPSIKCKPINVLHRGDKVKVDTVDNGWFRIAYIKWRRNKCWHDVRKLNLYVYGAYLKPDIKIPIFN